VPTKFAQEVNKIKTHTKLRQEANQKGEAKQTKDCLFRNQNRECQLKVLTLWLYQDNWSTGPATVK
jgi:hypothetical protein